MESVFNKAATCCFIKCISIAYVACQNCHKSTKWLFDEQLLTAVSEEVKGVVKRRCEKTLPSDKIVNVVLHNRVIIRCSSY